MVRHTFSRVWLKDDASRRSGRGPAASGWWEPGSLPRLTDLLVEVLVVCSSSWTWSTGTWSSTQSASLTCSIETWSFTPPRGPAWQRLGHMFRLADSLDRDLIICLASRTCSIYEPEICYEPYSMYLILRYRTLCMTEWF
jgi:hypothetical protein